MFPKNLLFHPAAWSHRKYGWHCTLRVRSRAFIAQLYTATGQAALGLGDQLLVLILALTTSIGVAGIPAASLVAIAVILPAVGLPVEAIGVVWLTDRILDMVVRA